MSFIDDTSTPMMIEEDLRMPFKIAYEGYNKEEFVKTNIVSEQDWGWINWSTGDIIDFDKNAEYYEATILQIK